MDLEATPAARIGAVSVSSFQQVQGASIMWAGPGKLNHTVVVSEARGGVS